MMQPRPSSSDPLSPTLTIDVAHPARPASLVESELTDAWTNVRNSENLRILKIIHGYGSSGKGGSTREVVRNWAYRHRHRFLGIIEGEEYSVFSRQIQEMRKEVGNFEDSDLEKANPGMLLIWIK